MNIADERSIAKRKRSAVNWKGVAAVVARRAWLLEELGPDRLQFDDIRPHRDNCNVDVRWHKGRAEVLALGCDCGAWKEAREYASERRGIKL